MPHTHLFSSDLQKCVRRHPEVSVDDGVIIYPDLLKRKSAPEVDVYIEGFPCQPWSSAGLQRGFDDCRGTVFYGCASYIDTHRPAVFMLENVVGLLMKQKGTYFRQIMYKLECVGGEGYYKIWHKVINTKDYGVPQNLPRI